MSVYWDFPDPPEVKTPCFHCRGAWVQSLMREVLHATVWPINTQILNTSLCVIIGYCSALYLGGAFLKT